MSEDSTFTFTLPQSIVNTAARLASRQHRNLTVDVNDGNVKLNITKPNSKFVTFRMPAQCVVQSSQGLSCYIHNVEVAKKAKTVEVKVEKVGQEVNGVQDEKGGSVEEVVSSGAATEPVGVAGHEVKREASGEGAPEEDTRTEGDMVPARRYSTRPHKKRVVQLLRKGHHPTDKEMVVPRDEAVSQVDGSTDDGDMGVEFDDASDDEADVDLPRKRRRKRGTAPPRTVQRKRPSYKREANIPCKLCGLKYKDHLVLFGHVKVMHENHAEKEAYREELKELMKVSCDLCGQVLKNRMLLDAHKVRKHRNHVEAASGEKFVCQYCSKEFEHAILLRDHVISFHKEKKKQTFLCHLCPAKFNSAASMRDHVNYLHEKKVLYQCEMCHKTFNSPRYLQRHMTIHGQVYTKCPHCPYITKHQYNMKRHIMDMHESQDKRETVPCTLCDKEFKNVQNMQVHLNHIHYKITPYYCSLCKRYLARKNDLMDHAGKYHPGMVVLESEDTKISKSDDGKYKEPKMQIVDRNILFLTNDAGEIVKSQMDDLSPAEVTVQVDDAATDEQSNKELIDISSAAAVLESLVAEVVSVQTQ